MLIKCVLQPPAHGTSPQTSKLFVADRLLAPYLQAIPPVALDTTHVSAGQSRNLGVTEAQVHFRLPSTTMLPPSLCNCCVVYELSDGSRKSMLICWLTVCVLCGCSHLQAYPASGMPPACCRPACCCHTISRRQRLVALRCCSRRAA